MKYRIKSIIFIAIFFVVSCSSDDKKPVYQGKTAPIALDLDIAQEIGGLSCDTEDNIKALLDSLLPPVIDLLSVNIGETVSGDCSANPGSATYTNASTFTFNQYCKTTAVGDITLNGSATVSDQIAVNLSIAFAGTNSNISGVITLNSETSFTMDITITDTNTNKQIKYENYNFNLSGTSSGRIYFSDFGYIDIVSSSSQITISDQNGASIVIDDPLGTPTVTFFDAAGSAGVDISEQVTCQ